MGKPPISNAKVNPRVTDLGHYPDGTVDVRCWCEADVVRVERSLLMVGSTGPCELECTPAEISTRRPRERSPRRGLR